MLFLMCNKYAVSDTYMVSGRIPYIGLFWRDANFGYIGVSVTDAAKIRTAKITPPEVDSSQSTCH